MANEVKMKFLEACPLDFKMAKKLMKLAEVNAKGKFVVNGSILTHHDRMIFLDPAHNPIATLRQKMHRRWEVYRGESSEILFTVEKSSILNFKTELRVFLFNNPKEKVPEFSLKFKGLSLFKRSYTIYVGAGDTSSTAIAHMRSKQIVLGNDTFPMTVYAFIVAIAAFLYKIEYQYHR